MRICPNCGGAKTIVVPRTTKTGVCRVCNGSGEIERKGPLTWLKYKVLSRILPPLF